MLRHDTADWKLLFASLLKTQPDQLNLSLEINNGSIIISTPDAKLANDLENILKSPQAVLSNIDYTLHEIPAGEMPPEPAPIPTPQYPAQIELTHGMGETFFTSLFTPNLRQKVGIAWSNENKNENNYILEAPCDPELIELTKAQINTFKQILAKATYEQLRQAIAADKSVQQPLQKQEASNGPMANVVDKILYLSSDHQKIYFDFGLLVKSLTPPKVEELVPVGATTSSNTEFVYSINQQHLMNYFGTIFQEGFVMHIDGDNAKQIFFNPKRAIPKKQSISIVVDCSGSMAAKENELKENVINFVNQMTENPQFKDTEITIIPFASTTGQPKTFNLYEKEEIVAHINSLKIDGKTALHSTIHQVLSDLPADCNTTAIIFTDGVNTDGMPLEELKALTDNLIKNTNNPPKIFTMGLGEKYNEEMLDALASSTGCKHIKLETMADFKGIYVYLDTISIARSLARILQESTNTAFILPVQEGCLNVSPVTLSFPGSFVVNGIEYHATKGGIQLQAAAEVAEATASTSTTVQTIAVSTSAGSTETPLNPALGIPDDSATLLSQFGLIGGPTNRATEEVTNALSKGSWCTIQ